jgi:hypothetical protein
MKNNITIAINKVLEFCKKYIKQHYINILGKEFALMHDLRVNIIVVSF